MKRYQETNSIEDRPCSGQPRSKRTLDAIKAMREKIHQNLQRCQTDLAVQHDMSRQSMGRLIHEDLCMRSYHLRKVHLLSELQKVKRKDRCAKILQCLTAGTLPNLIFSDEKLFTVQAKFNTQNDQVISGAVASLPTEVRSTLRRQRCLPL